MLVKPQNILLNNADTDRIETRCVLCTRFRVVQMGCHSHKMDNSMKAMPAAFLKAYAERPDSMQVPVSLPNKYQKSRVDRGEIVPGVMKGGFDLTFLTSALLEIPNAKESGRQVQWREFVEIRYRNEPKKPEGIGVAGKSRFHEQVTICGSILNRREDIIAFLDELRRDNGELGNLELNVYTGLHDTATLTEMCVMYVFAYELALPSMKIKKVCHSQWDLSPLYNEAERRIKILIEDVKPFLTGTEPKVLCELSFAQDESATITFDFETATQEAPGIFGDGVERPDAKVITKVRKRLAELSTEEFEHAEVLARKGLADFLVTFQRFAGPQLKSQRGVKQKNSVHLGGSLGKENERDFEIGQKVPITNDECEGNHGRYKQLHRGVTFVNLDNLESWALWRANKLNKALENGEIAQDVFYAAIYKTRRTMTRGARILKFAEINSERTKEQTAIRLARLEKVQAHLARLLLVSPCTSVIQVTTLIKEPSQFSTKSTEIGRLKEQWAYQRKVRHPKVKFPPSSKFGKEQLVDLIMQVVSFDFTTGLPFKYGTFDVAAAAATAATAAAAAGGSGGGREYVGEGGEAGGGGSASGGSTPDWFHTAEHVDEFMRTTTKATRRGATTKQSKEMRAQLKHLKQQGVPGCSLTLEGKQRTLQQLVDLLKEKLAERQPTRPEAPTQQCAPPLMDCQVHACD